MPIANQDTPALQQRWQRLTLLDLFLLQFGFAIGYRLIALLQAIARDDPGIPQPWPAQAGFVEVFIVGSVLGSAVAGPIIVFGQWAFRGRRVKLNAGELLWMSPTFLYAVFVCTAYPLSKVSRRMAVACLLLWVFAQTMCSIVAIAVLVIDFSEERYEVACPWTNRFGAVACLLAGGLLVYGICLH